MAPRACLCYTAPLLFFDQTIEAVVPIGFLPLKELMQLAVERGVPSYV